MRTMEMAAGAAERPRRLPECLKEYPGFREAVAALRQGGRVTFDGVWGLSCALLAAAFRRSRPCP